MMISTDDLVRILGLLAFRAADKFFKFVSWAIIIVGLRYAAHLTSDRSIVWLAEIAMTVFGTALVLQVIFLAVRVPGTLGVPESLHTASRVAQVILGASLMVVVASPFLYIDQIIERLSQAQISLESKP
ncbi:hypothetical protein [Methylorubrum extorquens]|uniref:hypothetical protein n=1 Tax=Methylorubrum extorquens TaxID=408 RepID=UPI001EE4F56E|nr:hypothetical protein [Methylorubrum extorquens]MCG5244747.1 hypothetical protein [Methylorubrum extorquens]